MPNRREVLRALTGATVAGVVATTQLSTLLGAGCATPKAFVTKLIKTHGPKAAVWEVWSQIVDTNDIPGIWELVDELPADTTLSQIREYLKEHGKGRGVVWWNDKEIGAVFAGYRVVVMRNV